jgi:hypothetical protein
VKLGRNRVLRTGYHSDDQSPCYKYIDSVGKRNNLEKRSWNFGFAQSKAWYDTAGALH